MGVYEDYLYGIATMKGNYEQRMVDHTDDIDWSVDTAFVTDRVWLYEVAVRHKDFREGDWIVVAGTSIKDDAQRLHNEWVEKMKTNPSTLYDIFEERYFRKSLREDD